MGLIDSDFLRFVGGTDMIDEDKVYLFMYFCGDLGIFYTLWNDGAGSVADNGDCRWD